MDPQFGGNLRAGLVVLEPMFDGGLLEGPVKVLGLGPSVVIEAFRFSVTLVLFIDAYSERPAPKVSIQPGQPDISITTG